MKYWLIVVFLIWGFPSVAQEKITIETKTKKETGEFKIDEFYFIHHIFADAFFMTLLQHDVDTNDIEKIIREVQPKLSIKNPVLVTIKREGKIDAYLQFTIYKKDGNTVLAMKTNYIQRTKEFVKEMDNPDLFVRMYFFKENKMVYRKDLYSVEEEAKRKKEGKDELVEFYLFNDNADDDSKIPELLEELASNDSLSVLDKLYAKLYSIEHHLLKGDISAAEKSLEEFNEYYLANKETIPTAYELIYKLAGLEMYLNRKIRKL